MTAPRTLPALRAAARLVLVTGSRSLARYAEAKAWLRSRLDELAPAVVVTGDATGPDRWAVEWAQHQPARDAEGIVRWLAPGADRTEWVVYALDASVQTADTRRLHVAMWWVREMAPASGSPDRARWPLRRNAAMVRDVATLAARYDVTVLALRSSTATTHGTEHTVRLCREAGLTVEEKTW